MGTITSLITRGDVPMIFGTLARHRRLFYSWLPFAGALQVLPELPRRDVELVILRTAWRCHCGYEWAQHVNLAARAGLDRHAIERVLDGPTADGWTPRQRALLTAVDELHDRHVISDATWTALAGELDERQLIELCLLVGHYEMLAMTTNSLGVEPEASAVRRLEGRSADALSRAQADLARARRQAGAGAVSQRGSSALRP
jgi:AhpD family alkylhydroperoxidase